MDPKRLIQTDLVAEIIGGAGFAAMIEQRLSRGSGAARDTFSVLDAAAIFEVGETKIRDYIKSGRLPAANLNKGMTCPVDPENPSGGERELRPLYRLTREALLNLAKSMEAGT